MFRILCCKGGALLGHQIFPPPLGHPAQFPENLLLWIGVPPEKRMMCEERKKPPKSASDANGKEFHLF